MEIKLDTLKDASKKVLYAGVGAIASLAEVTGDALEKLSEKGEKVAKESKVIQGGRQAVKEMKETLSAGQSARHFKHTMDNISDMTKEERDALRQKLDEADNFCCRSRQGDDGCECSEDKSADSRSCHNETNEELKDEVSDKFDDTKEGEKKMDNNFMNKLDDVKEMAKDTFDNVKEGVKDLAEVAKDKFNDLKDGATDKVKELKGDAKKEAPHCEGGTCSLEPPKPSTLTCDGDTCHLATPEEVAAKTEAPIVELNDFLDK